jgi:hypothetical protein
MKKMKILESLMILFLINSCNPGIENELNVPVTINRHNVYKQDSIKSSNTFFLDRIVHNDTLILNYKYQKSGDVLIFQLTKPLNSDSSITWYGTECKLISEQQYTVFQKELKIRIYKYDKLNSDDEECYIYYNDKYGCLAIDNYGAVGLCYTIDYDKNSKELNSLITSNITTMTKK